MNRTFRSSASPKAHSGELATNLSHENHANLDPKPHNHLIHLILSNDFWKGTPWKVNGWNTYKSPMKGKEHEFTNIHDYVPC